MSFPRYPSYKDSGVEWLREVPEHWEVKRLTAVCKFQSGKAHEQFIDDDGEFICVNSRFVSTEGLSRKFCTANFSPAKKNDILMVMSDLPNGRALAKAFFVDAEAPYAVNQRVCILSPFGANPKFLFYLLNRNAVFLQNDDGINQTHLSNAVFTKFPTLIPPFPEQTQIAAFLDRETAKIDELVTEQQRLMELLKEKRQAVISHAVTKGLNPDAPMKPSGIEWLGDVPAHWNVKRLKHLSPFITVGIVVNPSSFVANEGFPFIYGGDIREGVIDWTNSRRIDAESSEANSKTRLKAGDLLTVRVGAPGVTAVVPKECEGGNCASVMLIRQGSFNSDWLCYVMNTRVMRFQVEVVQYGAAQEQFNISHAVNFWAPTPPRAEQDAIVDFLTIETAKLDTLTTEAQRAIDLLQERRTALISAAVTGQIDVRQLTEQEPA